MKQVRAGLVTINGNPITLVGKEVRVGRKATDVEPTADDPLLRNDGARGRRDERPDALGPMQGRLRQVLRRSHQGPAPVGASRTVFVVDKQGIVRYVELVKEVAGESNCEAALKAAKGLM